MNREEIIKMDAGRCLDAYVATHVFGRTDLLVNIEEGSIEGDLDKPLPHRFSTDIAAAWLVVEKMSKDGFIFELLNVASDFVGINYGSSDTMRWTAAFEAEEKHGVVDATAPLAITKAALLAQLSTPNNQQKEK